MKALSHVASAAGGFIAGVYLSISHTVTKDTYNQTQALYEAQIKAKDEALYKRELQIQSLGFRLYDAKRMIARDCPDLKLLDNWVLEPVVEDDTLKHLFSKLTP